jgi:(p)ppGpp synthase/HD superfamily hydrolase
MNLKESVQNMKANFHDDVELARWIATNAHEGQTRWDKKTPYITHPEEVARRFLSPAFKSVALLHDVVEDTHWTLDMLRDATVAEDIVVAVDAITKREGEEYVDYLNRVVNNDMAAAVKLADLDHNLSNLKKGSMRDKYLLAKQFIIVMNKRAPYYLNNPRLVEDDLEDFLARTPY